MADQESNVKVKVTTEDKTKPGVDSAKGNFKQLKDGLGEVSKALTGMDLTTLGVVGAVTLAIGQARKAIDEYSAYADEMRKISSTTKLSVEETSRLVQAADDLRIGQDTVKQAMALAVQNGMVPSIANLAKLSDEYLALKNPVDQANLLQEKFGKSWKEIAPLMEKGGDAIREATAAVKEGQIVTDEAIQKNNEYLEAIDEMNDSWTAAKNNFAKGVIPVLTDLLEWVNRNTEAAEKNAEALNQGFGKVDGLAGGYGNLASQVRDATLAQIGMIDAERRSRDAARRNAQAHDEELAPAIEETKDSAIAANTEMRYFAQSVQDAANGAAIAAGHMDDLKRAQEEFNGTVQQFNSNFGQDVVSKLKNAGIEGEDLDKALQGVDSIMGTNYATEQKLNGELDKIIENYKKDGNVDTFTDALERNRNKWAEIDTEIQNAQTAFNNFITSVAGADGLQVEIVVNAVRAYGNNGSGNSNGYKPGTGGPGVYGYTDYMPDAGGAHGLSMVVPPGYDEINGRPFLIAAQSGEQVEISPTPVTRGNSGDTYILNAYHTQAPEVVQRGFSIMKAWAGV